MVELDLIWVELAESSLLLVLAVFTVIVDDTFKAEG